MVNTTQMELDEDEGGDCHAVEEQKRQDDKFRFTLDGLGEAVCPKGEESSP